MTWFYFRSTGAFFHVEKKTPRFVLAERALSTITLLPTLRSYGTALLDNHVATRLAFQPWSVSPQTTRVTAEPIFHLALLINTFHLPRFQYFQLAVLPLRAHGYARGIRAAGVHAHAQHLLAIRKNFYHAFVNEHAQL
jgi:hypothetical protein